MALPGYNAPLPIYDDDLCDAVVDAPKSPKRARAQTEVGMSSGYDQMAERLKALENSVSQQQLRMQQLDRERSITQRSQRSRWTAATGPRRS